MVITQVHANRVNNGKGNKQHEYKNNHTEDIMNIFANIVDSQYGDSYNDLCRSLRKTSIYNHIKFLIYLSQFLNHHFQ